MTASEVDERSEPAPTTTYLFSLTCTAEAEVIPGGGSTVDSEDHP